jgi:hypothetical protein
MIAFILHIPPILPIMPSYFLSIYIHSSSSHPQLRPNTTQHTLNPPILRRRATLSISGLLGLLVRFRGLDVDNNDDDDEGYERADPAEQVSEKNWVCLHGSESVRREDWAEEFPGHCSFGCVDVV